MTSAVHVHSVVGIPFTNMHKCSAVSAISAKVRDALTTKVDEVTVGKVKVAENA